MELYSKCSTLQIFENVKYVTNETFWIKKRQLGYMQRKLSWSNYTHSSSNRASRSMAYRCYRLHPLLSVWLKTCGITEKWLNKLGFTIKERWPSQSGDYFFRPDRKVKIGISTRYGNTISLNNEDDPDIYMISYVHELQNLYKDMTGETIWINFSREISPDWTFICLLFNVASRSGAVVACLAHYQEVPGSSPGSATKTAEMIEAHRRR